MHKNVEIGKNHLPISIINCIIIGLSKDSPILILLGAVI